MRWIKLTSLLLISVLLSVTSAWALNESRNTATAPVKTEGATGYDSYDLNSNLRITQGTLTAGEDLTATGAFAGGVVVTEQRYLYSGPKTADFQVKATAGFLHAITCNSDAAATAGSITLFDSTTASGTQIWTWTISAVEYQPRTLIFDVLFTTGLFLDFTTTADVTCTVSYR